jgi:hypothetical protein
LCTDKRPHWTVTHCVTVLAAVCALPVCTGQCSVPPHLATGYSTISFLKAEEENSLMSCQAARYFLSAGRLVPRVVQGADAVVGSDCGAARTGQTGCQACIWTYSVQNDHSKPSITNACICCTYILVGIPRTCAGHRSKHGIPAQHAYTNV